MFVLMIWGFVELYFLRGTRRTNRFGPNPLGKEQMPASERDRSATTRGTRTARSKWCRTKLARRRFGVLIRGHD